MRCIHRRRWVSRELKWTPGTINLTTAKKGLSGWLTLEMPYLVSAIILAAVRNLHAPSHAQPEDRGLVRGSRYIPKRADRPRGPGEGPRVSRAGQQAVWSSATCPYRGRYTSQVQGSPVLGSGVARTHPSTL